MLFFSTHSDEKGIKAMKPIYAPYQIKSFKHDGHLHRVWLENWRIPEELLHDEHRQQSIVAMVNCRTKILESDGKEWMSRTPSISFFLPQTWYNIVALIEPEGIRYYCNLASPPYIQSGKVLTYIDYDLDVLITSDGKVLLLDEEEYERHQTYYRYSPLVKKKVRAGLDGLMERIGQKKPPFCDETVMQYFDDWERSKYGADRNT